MNDRELLELAAKAAGFSDAEWVADQACISTARLPGFRCFWNPLADDGDALRLAVKLGITVECGGAWASKYGPMYGEDILPCPYAATRRAIVRAAAEIGRNME